MSSHSTVPFCSQELTRTAQVTVLPLGASSTRCLCVSTGRCERRLFSEGRRERSLFCGLCYVRSCAGGPHCPWDLSLSFWHPDPLILKDLVFSGELKIICSLFPIDLPRLPALYYVFLQQLREEGKISMVSNLPLGKPKLREVKSNHLDNLVKSIDVQFSAVSSSLLLSYDVAGLFPPSPHLPGTPQSSSV